MVKVRQLIATSPWIPQRPTGKQTRFLAHLHEREVFYGGAAGGGKSDALLIAALMYADVPGYRAVLFRRTYPELSQADGLIPRSQDWLGPTPAKWNEQKARWTFPSGATLQFAHMQRENDKYNYQGGQYQFIGFDELTGFSNTQYTYLLSRLRRLRSSPVPLRIRSASNPGNVGHQWVYERFVVGDKPFVPALLDDNPHLSTEEYKRNLEELDDITRAQLLDGLWVTDQRNKPFRRDFWRNKHRYHLADSAQVVARWISWDTAEKDKTENAYSACVVVELIEEEETGYRLRVREVFRDHLLFPDLVGKVRAMAERYDHDGKLRAILIEDKSSGASALQTLQASAPASIASKLKPFSPRAKKEERWGQAAVWCKRGCVLLPYASTGWLYDFEEELYSVPDAQYADQADAFSQVVIYLEALLAQGWRARGMPSDDGQGQEEAA